MGAGSGPSLFGRRIAKLHRRQVLEHVLKFRLESRLQAVQRENRLKAGLQTEFSDTLSDAGQASLEAASS